VNITKKREIAGIVLFATAVFLIICLVSYNSKDPSFWTTSSAPAVSNWGGFVGSYIAGVLMRLLGVSSLWIPALMLLYAVRLFKKEEYRFGWGSGTAFAGLLITSSCLVSLLLATMGITVEESYSGGVAGKFISDIFVYILHPAGSYIFLLVLFAVCLIITIDVSFASMLSNAIGFVRGRIDSWNEFSEARQERQEKRELQKEELARQPFEPPVILEDLRPVEKPARKKKARQPSFDFTASSDFKVPPLSLLDEVPRRDTKVKRESLLMNSRILEKKLADFGVEGKVTEVRPGPLITIYELEPAPGVKINRITNLADDLAMALKAPSVRIAPISGKSVVGVEIPNNEREPVHLRNCLENEEFLETKYRLPIALGEDTTGTPVIADLARMPHLLIAGTTGSGKSVSLNAMICSILLKALPEDVKMLMIDPKRLELSSYEGIPHLLHPVVVNPKDAAQVLRWAVAEMERRYRVISEVGVKNIDKYNKHVEEATGRGKPVKVEPEEDEEAENGDGPAFTPSAEATASQKEPEKRFPLVKLPYIIIVIDEMADLMMVAQRNVEESLTRLAQMARAAGIHLILATQRPSVDVITGIIKANFPTRISFQVSSKVDSRTILDQLGAEQLLGAGDMLFMPPGTSRLIRIHGAFVSDREIERIVGFLKKQGDPSYDESILQEEAESGENGKSDDDYDEKYDEAVELVTELGQASISLVQRYLKVGYNRAARMIEKMEAEGVVGPSDGVKPRKVLARKIT